MNLSDITNIRLISQQIAGTKFKTPKEIVGWMGAIQAQDYNMAKWAIGLRLPGLKDDDVEKVFNEGKILRTHVLRPTWHFVTPDDIRWMLELTAPRILSSLAHNYRSFEWDNKFFKKANRILTKASRDKMHLTRDEVKSVLNKGRINTEGLRLIHLLAHAELEGILCSGEKKGKQFTYALLEERVPAVKNLHKDEALAKLAHTYFTSHCPATLHDFTWWSGLSVTEGRRALEMINSNFVAETIGLQTYWFPNSFSASSTGNKSIYLLPAYDEFIISYRDRSATLRPEHYKKSISENGLFRPVIVTRGQVTGLWKRTTSKDKVIVETAFFQPHNKTQRKLIGKAAKRFGMFLNRKTELIINDE